MKKVVSGILVVDKPAGMTSFSVVSRVRRASRVKKVGHTGTLDPMATGVLPLVLGQATKLVPYIQAGEKEYTGRFLLGMCTDTDDVTGQVTAKKTGFELSPADIIKTAQEFIGTIDQVPPQFSAVKIDGRPAYKRARKGEKVLIQSRRVTVSGLEITGIELPLVSFHARVSKGTYIRSLVADIGRRLGTGACLESLRRVGSIPFTIEDAVGLDAAMEAAEQGCLEDLLIPMENALHNLPQVAVPEEHIHMVQHGRPLPLEYVGDFRPEASGPVQIRAAGIGLLAIYEYMPGTSNGDSNCLTPVRVLGTG